MLLQFLQKALHAKYWSPMAKDETSGPFLVTCSLIRKNDEKKSNYLKFQWCCGAIHCHLRFQSSLKRLAYEGFKLLYLVACVPKCTNIASKCFQLYCIASFQTKIEFTLMYGSHVVWCQSYIWSTTILHNTVLLVFKRK